MYTIYGKQLNTGRKFWVWVCETEKEAADRVATKYKQIDGTADDGNFYYWMEELKT